MGVHISFVRSLDLDSFSEQDVKQLLCGGNQTCRDFFEKHGGSTVTGIGTGTGTGKLLEKYDCNVARLYRETIKARVHGRPEPSMNDIILAAVPSNSTMSTGVKQIGGDDTGTGRNNDKLVYHKNNQSKYSTGKLINVEYFVGALKYWINRLILLPASNNRTACVLILVIYISTKIAIVKTSKVSECNNNFVVIFRSIHRFFFFLFTSLSAIIFISSCLSIKWFRVHRQEAFKSAMNSFQDRVNNARVKRNLLYDLYFPPQVSVGSHVSKAIIFFPDILVDRTAYAFVLGKISDCGILVVAVNLDPMRLSGVITNKISPDKMVSKIGFEIQHLLGIKVDEWILMSHGEGACAVSHAMRVTLSKAPVVVVAQNTRERFVSPHPTRCILWSPTSFIYDLRKMNISTLVIQAVESSKVSCDGCVEELIRRLQIKVPSNRCQVHNVVGGSHSGFAHYGPATFRKDNVQRIKSLGDQQNEVRDVSVEFILRKYK